MVKREGWKTLGYLGKRGEGWKLGKREEKKTEKKCKSGVRRGRRKSRQHSGKGGGKIDRGGGGAIRTLREWKKKRKSGSTKYVKNRKKSKLTKEERPGIGKGKKEAANATRKITLTEKSRTGDLQDQFTLPRGGDGEGKPIRGGKPKEGFRKRQERKREKSRDKLLSDSTGFVGGDRGNLGSPCLTKQTRKRRSAGRKIGD